MLKRSEYLPKEIFEPLIKNNLTVEEISKKLGISIYKIKMSLIEHKMFYGKVYNTICESCLKPFSHFVKGYKYCSNECKHKHQLTWNRGKNKYTDKRIESLSKFAMENDWGIVKAEKLSNVFLPNKKINIKYNSKSKIERDFLLSLDSNKDIISVKRNGIVIPYVDSESNQPRHYIPDFLVTWSTGLQWLVEIKGIFQLNELDKIAAGQKYAVENNMRYKLITKGLIKYNMWNQFYLHTSKYLIPSREYVMMNNAIMQSLFSCSHLRRVGCIITSIDYQNLLSYGYNGDEKDGPNMPPSFDSGKSEFIHAEENALIKLHTKEPSILFITDAPCQLCAKKIINTESIKEVYYLREYKNMEGIGLLISHGIKTYKFQLLDNKLSPLSDNDAFKKMLPAGIYEDDWPNLYPIE